MMGFKYVYTTTLSVMMYWEYYRQTNICFPFYPLVDLIKDSTSVIWVSNMKFIFWIYTVKNLIYFYQIT